MKRKAVRDGHSDGQTGIQTDKVARPLKNAFLRQLKKSLNFVCDFSKSRRKRDKTNICLTINYGFNFL